MRTLGGPAVLVPVPPPRPLRQLVLWGLLVLGAAVLLAMSLNLLRSLRQPS
jgi:hypothetical protein